MADMKSVLRVAVVLSSVALLFCCVWLAQIQAHGQPPPAIHSSKSGILRVPMEAILKPPPVMISSSKSFSGTVITGNLLLSQNLWSFGKKDAASKASPGAGGNVRAQAKEPTGYALNENELKHDWHKFSMFEREVFVPDLRPANRYELQHGMGVEAAASSALHGDVEVPRTLLGVLPVFVRPDGWKDLLPDYSDLTTIHRPTVEAFSAPLVMYTSSHLYLSSTRYFSISGRMQAWLNAGLASDFRELTQEVHHERQIFLTPFLFKSETP